MRDPEVLVIGGGAGGLTAAGLLAARGASVMLVEKEARVGGYVAGFRREGIYFDATGAFVAACQDGGEFHRILEEIGASDRLRFLPIGPVWNVYTDFDLRLDYAGRDRFASGLAAHFPEQAEALTQYLELVRSFGEQFMRFEDARAWEKLLLPWRFPALWRYARSSHGQVLRQFFGGGSRIERVLSTLPTTLPPGRLSYAFVAVLWTKVLGGGVFYPLGGMQALSEVLAQGLRRNGGMIACGQPVVEILTRRRRAVGVRLGDGTEIRARWIVGAVSPYAACGMLPRGRGPWGAMHRLSRFQPSLSAVLFYLALPAAKLPPDWPYFVSIQSDKDPAAMYAALEAGSLEEGLHLVVTVPGLLDPQLMGAGCYGVKVLMHAPRCGRFEARYGGRAAIERMQTQVFAMLARRTGLDLNAHARVLGRATPDTLQRRTGNIGGAMYGLDAACGQVGPQRPPNRTRLDNLLWVGHYTRPSHGIVGSAMAGRFAADIVCAKVHR